MSDIGAGPAGGAGGAILDGYRVLDLTDDRGALCGRMFAELGADVMKIEPIGGCRTRRIDPFIGGVPGPDRSAYFIAYQAGKRSVTLNLETADGRKVLEDLAATADFLVDSYGEHYLSDLGVGYERLAEINPRLIYTTITPFGDRGPSADWKAADVTSWAAGGMMFLIGNPEQPPLQISVPQSNLHAGAEAATASLLAHFSRVKDGQGQRVMINTQACVVWTLMNEQAFPLLHGDFLRRTGGLAGYGVVARKQIFEVADGHVSLILGGEGANEIVSWMAAEGAAPDWLLAVDWAGFAPALLIDAEPELLDRLQRSEGQVETWLRTKTKAELYRGALDRRILLAPVANVKDVFEDQQLAARDYFRTVGPPGAEQVLPGPFVKYSAVPRSHLGPAPHLGEHNVEVYRDLLGYPLERLRHLYAAGII